MSPAPRGEVGPGAPATGRPAGTNVSCLVSGFLGNLRGSRILGTFWIRGEAGATAVPRKAAPGVKPRTLHGGNRRCSGVFPTDTPTDIARESRCALAVTLPSTPRGPALGSAFSARRG